MGIYSNNSQKKQAVWEQLILLQPVIEEIDGIVIDNGYDELVPLVKKLHEIYGQLDMCNNMGVGLK